MGSSEAAVSLIVFGDSFPSVAIQKELELNE
jgi:hypothetical protein